VATAPGSGDAALFATGALLEPGSAAFCVVPSVVPVDGAVEAVESWTQPTANAATSARIGTNREARFRYMRANITP
jgi:hypothetical protein